MPQIPISAPATQRQPVPPVSPDDMKRIWAIPAPADVKFLARLCSPNADVMAVSRRVMVLKLLLKQKLLEPWREGDSVQNKVFEVFARCSLAQRGGPGEGKLEFDFPAILRSLEEPSH